jgi:hypothetical protein
MLKKIRRFLCKLLGCKYYLTPEEKLYLTDLKDLMSEWITVDSANGSTVNIKIPPRFVINLDPSPAQCPTQSPFRTAEERDPEKFS